MDIEEPNDPSREGSGPGPDLRREARQRAYRARQREVAALLGRLWRLRRQREAGGRPVGIAPDRQWEEFAVLVRQLIHEEELLAGLHVARRIETAEPGRVEGRPGAAGMPPTGPLTTAHKSAVPLSVPTTGEEDRLATGLPSPDTAAAGSATRSETQKGKDNGRRKKGGKR